jgi:Spy/CpxP family protein refolding chaperone
VGALVVVLLASSSLWAQEPSRRGGGPGFGGPGFGGPGRSMDGAMLLRSEQVQQEVKLTDEQKSRLKELADKLRAKMDQRRAETEKLTPEERRARFEKMRETMQKEMEAQAAETHKQIAEILQPEQLKRLKQIQLQQEGPSALRRPEVAEALGLSKDQTAELEKAATENQEKAGKLFQSAWGQGGQDRGQRGGTREKMQELRKEFEQKAMGVLSGDQKKKLVELMGPQFELDRSKLFPGRGEGRDRRRGDSREAPPKPETK